MIPKEELADRLRSGRPLRVKHGVDPTAPHVHLGWAVPLRKLRQFQELGHVAVLVVGDFTARIGDPSGQNRTRPMLSKQEVDGFAARVLEQIKTILLHERLEVRPNSEWLEALGTQGVLELSSNYTVARTLERDDFAKRYQEGSPITLREFLYPLLQGYDSVVVEADVELGGTDQHHSFMVARHLQRSHGQDPQVVMTMPILEGTDGVKKMSQSLGNYVGVTEEPDEMFGKLMRIPDELMGKYLRLTTDLSDEEVERLERELEEGTRGPHELKRVLAKEVIKLYHSEEAAVSAGERFDRIFVRHEAPEGVEEVPVPPGCVKDGVVHLPVLLKEIGLVSSGREARRLISQGGVHLEGETVESEDLPFEQLSGRLLRVGKRRFVRLV